MLYIIIYLMLASQKMTSWRNFSGLMNKNGVGTPPPFRTNFSMSQIWWKNIWRITCIPFYYAPLMSVHIFLILIWNFKKIIFGCLCLIVQFLSHFFVRHLARYQDLRWILTCNAYGGTHRRTWRKLQFSCRRRPLFRYSAEFRKCFFSFQRLKILRFWLNFDVPPKLWLGLIIRFFYLPKYTFSILEQISFFYRKLCFFPVTKIQRKIVNFDK